MTDCGRVKEEEKCHHNVHIHIDFYPARTDLQMYSWELKYTSMHAFMDTHACIQCKMYKCGPFPQTNLFFILSTPHYDLRLAFDAAFAVCGVW